MGPTPLGACLLCAATVQSAQSELRNVGVVFREFGEAKARQLTLRRLRREGVKRLRLLAYDDASIEEAARALGAEARIVVSVPDEEVDQVSASPANAARVCETIQHWVRRGTVHLVVVGVTPPSGIGSDASRTAALAAATRNVAEACTAINASVAVSTGFSLSVLRSSFPPSASLLAAPSLVRPILEQLRATSSPFVIEIDPYLAWRQSYYDISLEYAIFQKAPGLSPPEFVDDVSGGAYWNLFDAMLDAVRWALLREDFADLPIVVGRVGWPSGWIGLEPVTDARTAAGATLANAAQFNSGLARHMNCSRSAVPAPPAAGRRRTRRRLGSLPERCAPTLAFVYEAADPAEADARVSSDGLRWGVCAASGSLKYTLSTGVVLAPSMRVSREGCAALCLLFERCPPLRTAALFLAALLAACVVCAVILYAGPRRWRASRFRRHSPDHVATIIQSTRAKAEANLRDERCRRARLPPTPISRVNGSLPPVAESPIASDVDDDIELRASDSGRELLFDDEELLQRGSLTHESGRHHRRY